MFVYQYQYVVSFQVSETLLPSLAEAVWQHASDWMNTVSSSNRLWCFLSPCSPEPRLHLTDLWEWWPTPCYGLFYFTPWFSRTRSCLLVLCFLHGSWFIAVYNYSAAYINKHIMSKILQSKYRKRVCWSHSAALQVMHSFFQVIVQQIERPQFSQIKCFCLNII